MTRLSPGGGSGRAGGPVDPFPQAEWSVGGGEAPWEEELGQPQILGGQKPGEVWTAFIPGKGLAPG